MTSQEKYRELVALLKECGVLQLDTPWAEQVQRMIENHRKGISHDHQQND